MDFFQTFLKSRLAILGLAVLLAAVGFISFKLWVQKYQVDKEINKLQARSDELQNKNRKLSELIKYFQTPEYTQQQAREKLNLKKEGEHVVVLPKGAGEEESIVRIEKSNPKKWFDYFFLTGFGQ